MLTDSATEDDDHEEGVGALLLCVDAAGEPIVSLSSCCFSPLITLLAAKSLVIVSFSLCFFFQRMSMKSQFVPIIVHSSTDQSQFVNLK